MWDGRTVIFSDKKSLQQLWFLYHYSKIYHGKNFYSIFYKSIRIKLYTSTPNIVNWFVVHLIANCGTNLSPNEDKTT